MQRLDRLMSHAPLQPVHEAADWSPASWQQRSAVQQPQYPDAAALDAALREARALPPLVTSWEVERSSASSPRPREGKRFLLQGGDCAESFDDCDSGTIANKLKILLQMSLVLVHGAASAGDPRRPLRRPVRQAALGRHRDARRRDAASYRGDIVNRAEFTPAERTPDPAAACCAAYERAALTLNFIRALIDGGFADLHHPEYWDLGFVQRSPLARRVPADGRVRSAKPLRFMETLTGQPMAAHARASTSSPATRALHLPYEQAQTRQVPRRGGWYNLSHALPVDRRCAPARSTARTSSTSAASPTRSA